MAARPWSMPRCCAHDGAASSWRLLARELRGAVKSVCARSAQQATFSLAPVYFQGTWHRISASLRDFRATFGVAALLHRWWRSRRLFEKKYFRLQLQLQNSCHVPSCSTMVPHAHRTTRFCGRRSSFPARPQFRALHRKAHAAQTLDRQCYASSQPHPQHSLLPRLLPTFTRARSRPAQWTAAQTPTWETKGSAARWTQRSARAMPVTCRR